MVHTERIVRDLELTYTGVFDLKEFLNLIKKFFGRYDYDLDEKQYDTKSKEDTNDTTIKWEFDRRLDDYNKGKVKLTIKINNYTEAYLGEKRVVNGEINIKINGEMIRDYEEKWKRLPTRRFFRALYDQYIGKEREDIVTSSLKDMIESFRKEVKKYFKI